jgi:glycosyltransferase involved in cell wall biosynthesis
VLALSPIPEEGAGCRFRVAQYIPYLETAGFDVRISSFYTPEFFRLVYQHGHHARKAFSFARLALRRLFELFDLHRYDLVLLYREAIPFGPPFIESLIARRGIPIVYDFDDAIFLPNVSEANRAFAFLKQPSRVARILRQSTHVIVGNEFLAGFARRYNSAVTVVPTAVDTDRFVPRSDDRTLRPKPVVGWIGSPTTFRYLEGLADVLRRVAVDHRFVLKVSGAGRRVDFAGLEVEDVPWSLADEVRLFNSCDIGVYPLTDDDWARGKCGFKAIQCMACGVPVVASAVGVNREIIQDGVNGFLASTPDEWVEKLGRLISEPDLRARMAVAGRHTIEERYSLRVTAPRIAAVLAAAADGRADTLPVSRTPSASSPSVPSRPPSTPSSTSTPSGRIV